MQVGKGLDNEIVAIVLHRRAGILLRQHWVYAGDVSVLGDEIAVLRGLQPAQRRGGDDAAL